jgi:hypothetical protein
LRLLSQAISCSDTFTIRFLLVIGRTDLTISDTIIYFFTIVVIISLVLRPSLAATVNKPSEIPAGTKTTEAPPVKETKDDQGNTVMSGRGDQ